MKNDSGMLCSTVLLEILATRVYDGLKFVKNKIIRKMLDLTMNTCYSLSIFSVYSQH